MTHKLTTKEVKDTWTMKSPGWARHDRQSAFDDWLEELLAAAWDEGHADGQHNEREHRSSKQLSNPYREAGE